MLLFQNLIETPLYLCSVPASCFSPLIPLVDLLPNGTRVSLFNADSPAICRPIRFPPPATQQMDLLFLPLISVFFGILT